MLKAGERLYTGAIVSEEFATTYNLLTAKVEAYGANAPEELLNGRHNLFASYAVANRNKGN